MLFLTLDDIHFYRIVKCLPSPYVIFPAKLKKTAELHYLGLCGNLSLYLVAFLSILNGHY